MRASDIYRAFQKLLAAVQDWDQADGPHVPWQGQVTKGISQRLDEAFRVFLDATADFGKQPEPKAYGPLLAVDQLATAYLEFVRAASMGHDTAPPRGSDALWRAWDSVVLAFAVPKQQRPPAIKELIEHQKAAPSQIALIYGWTTEDGEPDLTKVQEEYQAPGTHFDPETWVAPAFVKRQAIFDREWKARTPRKPEFDGAAIDEAAEKPKKPPVPSLDELIAAKAPAGQIAMLHGISVDEAADLLADAGVVNERFIQPANATVAHQERMAELDAQEAAEAGGVATATEPAAKSGRRK